MLSEPERSVEVHPVQKPRGHGGSQINTLVTLRAYEVYCRLFGKQEALVTGHCRGGFGAGELIGLLYARSFPKEEWRDRFDEAMNGIRNL